jgi:hypothetical protein
LAFLFGAAQQPAEHESDVIVSPQCMNGSFATSAWHAARFAEQIFKFPPPGAVQQHPACWQAPHPVGQSLKQAASLAARAGVGARIE